MMAKMFSADGEGLTADDLSLISQAIAELRTDILFSPDMEDADFTPLSKQDYLLGLSALEQAERHFEKAALFRAAELAGRL